MTSYELVIFAGLRRQRAEKAYEVRIELGRTGEMKNFGQVVEKRGDKVFEKVVTGTWQAFGLPQEGMKIASRPPRGGGSPHSFLGKLCGSQLIDFKLEIGGPFPRNGKMSCPYRACPVEKIGGGRL